MKLLRTAGVLLALGLAAAGCTKAAESSPAPAPSPSPSASSPNGPASNAPSDPGGSAIDRPAAASSAGSDGLTVRYRAADGSIKTVEVEDFRR